MKYPNFNEEKQLWKRGYNFVAGLDEAGRGPLAGPVVAAAVLIDKNAKIGLEGINDSKKLSEKQREEYYNILVNNKDVKWGIGIVSEKIIDKINILQATKLAMEVALVDLNPDYLLLDGNFKINSIVRQMPVVGGDGKVFSIAAASIIAKVTRDRMMQNS
jgi:ribonuclease HII